MSDQAKTQRNADEQADEGVVDESAFAETLSADDVLPGEEASTTAATEEAATEEEPPVEEQLAAEKDRSLRLQAELQNVINRAGREVAEQRKYAALPLIKDLLPAMDTIDRALEAAATAGDESDAASGVIEGFRLVRQQLVGVLTQHHCEPVDPVGEPFDPNFHEAILQQPSADQPAGVVLQSAQVGYRLHDRVVRPAQVIVSSGSASAG